MDRLTRDQLQAAYQGAVSTGVATRGAHVTPEGLQALVERNGSEAERLAAMDHVMSCAVCREGYALLTAVRAAEPEAMRRSWIPLALAASALLVLGLGTARLWRPGSVSDTMRSGVAVPEPVSPAGVVVAADARTFTWHAVPGAIRYDLELLADDGQAVHSVATLDTSYALPFNVALGSGRTYQWLVSAELPGGQRLVAPAASFVVR